MMLPKWVRSLFGTKKRKFKAAKLGRLTADWPSAPSPINQDLRTEQKVLIARARDLAQNNDYARRFLSMAKNNVIGPQGITLQSRPPNRSGGVGVDKPAANVIERGWADWGRYGNPETTGKLSWKGIQRLFLDHVLRDGEVFAQKIPDERAGLKIKFIDPLSVPVDLNVTNPSNGNRIVMGIELDSDDRPVTYYVRPLKPEDISFSYNGTNFSQIPAEMMLHRFMPEFSQQTRGFSPMVGALYRLNMLGSYEEAAVVGARIGASAMGFFVENDEGATFDGDGEDAQGNDEIPLEPGWLGRMPFGSDLKTFDPKAPSIVYAEFVKAALRGIASGLGVSYATLANDLENVNFSSIRAGTLEDREVWKCLQEWVIEAFCEPLFADWLRFSLFAGNLSFPANGRPLDVNQLDRYRVASWQPRRWEWVDPLKDVQASKLLIDEGLMSRSAIIRQQGRDPEDVWQEIAAENKTLEEMGISVGETNVVEVETSEEDD